MNWQFFRFVLVGGFATALHWLIYWLLLGHLQLDLAYAIGYVVSFFVNFYLTAYFTFRRRPTWNKGFGFAAAHACNYLVHEGLLHLYLWLGVPAAWAPLPVFAVAVPLNFVLVRYVFRPKR